MLEYFSDRNIAIALLFFDVVYEVKWFITPVRILGYSLLALMTVLRKLIIIILYVQKLYT